MGWFTLPSNYTRSACPTSLLRQHCTQRLRTLTCCAAERGDSQLQYRVLGLAAVGAGAGLGRPSRCQPAARLHRACLLATMLRMFQYALVHPGCSVMTPSRLMDWVKSEKEPLLVSCRRRRPVEIPFPSLLSASITKALHRHHPKCTRVYSLASQVTLNTS